MPQGMGEVKGNDLAEMGRSSAAPVHNRERRQDAVGGRIAME
jgi:hypothetical protein